MLTQISATLSQLFIDTIYRVPDYQRSYSWTEKQLDDLWKDITETFAAGTANHFLGTLILEPTTEVVRKHGQHLRVFNVIDGQQRLTSIVVLVRGICKLLWNDTELKEVAENLYDKFIAYYHQSKVDCELQKLVLGREDNGYFWSAILDPYPVDLKPSTLGQRRLSYAQRFFDQRLRGIPTQELVKFADNIQSRLLLLSYQVGHELEAGLIFQTINDRGKELSQLDKVKSYLMYIASKTQSRNLSHALNDHWGELLRNVADVNPELDDTEAEENRLLRYHWIMETGEHRSFQIHREVKNRYKLNEADVPEQATEYVKSLREASELYLKVLHPDKHGLFAQADESIKQKIEYYIHCLHRLGTVANFVPLLMASLHRFREEPQLFATVARYCCLLAWRAYGVCGRRADTALPALSSLAYAVFKQGRQFSEVETRLKGLVESYGDNFEFEWHLKWGKLSSTEYKFLLYEYETYLSEQAKQPTVDWQVAQTFEIEHIWPQQPIGFDSWDYEIIEQHNRIVNQLGNLAIVPPPWNPQLSNRPLSEKRSKYSNSNLQCLRKLCNDKYFQEVCAFEENKAQPAEVVSAAQKFIENRTAELVNFALDRWKV